MKRLRVVLVAGRILGAMSLILPTARLQAQVVADSAATRDSSAIVVAVLDFKNNSGMFALDDLEKSVPEMLKTELSRPGSGLFVVERQKLEAVFQEQVLGQSGVIDEKTVQAVGQLVGAQYLLTGEISLVDSRLRIDCHILKTTTGQVRGEKVIGSDREVIDEMVNLLAANILFNLKGEGRYTQKLNLKKYPSAYFLWATAVAAAATGAAHWIFHDAYSKYQDATRLGDFEKYYNRSDNFRKVRNGLAIASGTLAITSAILWLKNRSEDNQILAMVEPQHQTSEQRVALFVNDREIGLQFRLNFLMR